MLHLPPFPPSRFALWSQRLIALAMIVAALGLAGARLGILPPLQGLAVLVAGLLVGLVSLIVACVAAVEIWNTGARGFARMLSSVVLALSVLAYPAWLMVNALRLPAINDISTDLVELPNFSRSRAALDARGGWVPGESLSRTREAQAVAYPAIKPLTVETDAQEAFDLAVEAAETMGWRILDRARPAGRSGQGRIDAVATSRLLRFPDDIVVRIRPLGNETRIDARSVSRYGRHDLGANAARIQSFFATLVEINRAP